MRLRIVRDNYAGYEVQAWRWWLPVWLEVGLANTHPTVERAEAFARDYANGFVVKQVEL